MLRVSFSLLLSALLALPMMVRADSPPPLEPLLQEEIQRLDRALAGRMGVVLFRTDDPVLRGFISAGILRVPEEAYVRLESGLAAVTVLTGFHNGVQRPMCYVLYNPLRSKPTENGYYLPIGQATGDYRQAAAFLAGHETGHCLDQLEREAIRSKSMRWTSVQANLAGLQPAAFGRVFGASDPTTQVATASYASKVNELYGDLAQRQYEERVADAFGVLWVWRLGGSAKVLEALTESRRRERPINAHATAPILEAVPTQKEALAQTEGIDQVWALARGLQRQVGVDAALGPGSQVAKNPLAEGLKKAKAERPVAPPAPPPRTKKWNEIPRFGAPAGR